MSNQQLRWAWTLALALAAATGCVSPESTTCADGRICPASLVCFGGEPDKNTQCVEPGSVNACIGKSDGEICDVPAGGRCTGGLCAVSVCGNGVIEGAEVCDDCNTLSGDGCRSDCLAASWQLGRASNAQQEGQPARLGILLAANAVLSTPFDVAVDSLGQVYIADFSNHQIRKVDTAGVISTVAGTGTPGVIGDDGPATAAQLNQPSGIFVDGLGQLFIADTNNSRIRKVDTAGVITTVAGNGSLGFSGDEGPATAAALKSPIGVAVDGLGQVFIADTQNSRIRKVDTAGVITTIAGIGTEAFSGDGGPAALAELNRPSGVAVDALGQVFIADFANHRIRKVDTAGSITTLAGAGTPGDSGDGGPATIAELNAPYRIAVDILGQVFIADFTNHQIRKVNPAGIIVTVIGTGTLGFSGDSGLATAAQLTRPAGVAVDALGQLFIADSGNSRIRRVDTENIVTTLAGTAGDGFGGDRGLATAAELEYPTAVAVDSLGQVFVADTNNSRIRKVDTTGVITTVAGIGTGGGSGGFSGDDGPATTAELNRPNGVSVDATGRILFADTQNSRIRKVDTAGVITTVAGSDTRGFSGDGGAATAASLNTPFGVALDATGQVFIADTQNSRIRRVDTAGVITTVAGSGTLGFAGDGGLATGADLLRPFGVAVDGMGQIFIADNGNNRIRKVDTAGIITTIAGTGTGGFSGDGGPATAAELDRPLGVSVDSLGQIFITDGANSRIRKVDTSGVITTIAGSNAVGASGDGGPAIQAELSSPFSVSVDALGQVFIADSSNNRIRKVDTSGVITTVAGQVDPFGVGPQSVAKLSSPIALAVEPSFALFAGGTNGVVQRLRGDTNAIQAGQGVLEVLAGRYLGPTVATDDLARFRGDDFGEVNGIAYDENAQILYLSETGNGIPNSHRVHKVTIVDPDDKNTWTIESLAGGEVGFADGTAAQFSDPSGLLLVAEDDTLYVADTGNHAIRRIDLVSGAVTTVVGVPLMTGGSPDENGPANEIMLRAPRALVRCPSGDLYIADTGNHRVLRVDARTCDLAIEPGMCQVTEVLGDDVGVSSGEGSPSYIFPAEEPRGLYCDRQNNLYVTSTSTVRLLTSRDHDGDPSTPRVVDGQGDVQSILADPVFSFSCLTGIDGVNDDTVWVTDSCTGTLLELTRPIPSDQVCN